MEKYNIQVSPNHYKSKEYDNLDRFISYYKQLELIKKNNPKKILEIGIGNGFLSQYIKNNTNMDISTCDFDKDLKPDFVSDIRNLIFDDNSYDVVTSFEVLEHLPLKDLDKALSELSRVSSNKVIISIPCSSFIFEMYLKFPLLYLFFDKYLYAAFSIPKFFKKKKFDGQHYWELGNRGSSKKDIRKKIKKYFSIVSEEVPRFNRYHYFFVLEKK